MFDNLRARTGSQSQVSAAPESVWDVIIVGAGVLGCLVASALARYRLQVLLIEREIDLGMGVSAGNSAVIHAGYDPVQGSLKARTNLAGNALWGDLARDLDIPFQRCGSLVVAMDSAGLPRLRELFGRGTENGVAGLRIVFQPELGVLEPALNPAAYAGLWAPSAGIIDPFAACLATAELAALNGVHFRFETELVGLTRNGPKLTALTTAGAFETRFLVNCAGLESAAVMSMADPEQTFRIVPRRGEYLLTDQTGPQPRRILFPIPNINSKGILVTPTTHGNTLLGPNATPVSDKADNSTTASGLAEVLAGGHKLVPGIAAKSVIAQYSGLRASGSSRDFILAWSPTLAGVLNLAGIDSPGFAAAPALALEAVGLLRSAGLPADQRPDFIASRRAIPRFALLDAAARQELADQDRAWSRIVCRCELVTEAEVLAALHSPIPARSYDGIKRRTWLGTSRCQGAFDLPRVIELICRETGCPPEAVTKRGGASAFISGRTR